MKVKKFFIALFMTTLIIFNFITSALIPTFAHSAMLGVVYDNCIDDDMGDGIDEMWYALQNENYTVHISHNVETITYRFVDDPAAGYSWTPSGEDSTVGENIKAIYAASMEKWNNVYFYSYNEDGTITKNKLINIVETIQDDATITIYPSTTLEIGDIAAQVIPTGYVWQIEDNTINHYHAPTWRMDVNIDAFYDDSDFALRMGFSGADITLLKAYTGAHETGHVLGLLDLDNDNLCNADNSGWHHHEVLMGYGNPTSQRSANITYKDIAGVAITRGFHTDSDHKWLNCGLQSDGKYKLVCSICNGVKNVSSLSGYTYNTYGACGNNHSLSSGNMMAVASYGNKDYYKCEYCRYVAPFDSNVTQNYTKTYQGNNIDKYVNTVSGLEYTFYQEHTHSYHYEWKSEGRHTASCECGSYVTESHTAVPGSFGGPTGYGICMYCHGRVSMGTLLSVPEGLAHTDNGSYILPNGNIILVEEDVEAYLAGTLEFYYGEKE